ncbi:hypothetical protein [Burkholderia sp. MSMB1072]|uniref:hypothetical protein n=1 Tax=Burkholderia sp. MSMB1072 TaxID=1637871 RepID=UPI0012E3973F|nr:hypothetical protein [Burkholderia sp. MSMB1072]
MTNNAEVFEYVPAPGIVTSCKIERGSTSDIFERVTVEVSRDRLPPNRHNLGPDRIQATLHFAASGESVNAVQLNALRQAIVVLQATISDLESKGKI